LRVIRGFARGSARAQNPLILSLDTRMGHEFRDVGDAE
jgi:hypothetical protein